MNFIFALGRTALKYFLTIIVLLASIAFACADIPANQTPETQGFDTDTMVQAVGLVMESDSLVWQGSTYVLDDPPLSLAPGTVYIEEVPGEPGYYSGMIQTPWGPIYYNLFDTPEQSISPGDIIVLDDLTQFEGYGVMPKVAGEMQYVTSYNEDTIADSGLSSYTKTLNIDTRNKVANQENFNAVKLVDFVGSNTGAITSDESLLLDTAGEIGGTEDLFTCPFGSNLLEYYPQFCNIEEMGNTLNMRQMSLSTSASDRFTAVSADTPITMDYTILVNGVGDAPALGDVTAYMNVHSMEGRLEKMWDGYQEGDRVAILLRPELALDNVYNEETTARGAIYHFQKDMSYTSGFRRTD